MLNLLMPVWTWVTIAIIVVVAAVLIALVIVLSKKAEKKGDNQGAEQTKKAKKNEAAEEETAAAAEAKPATRTVKTKPAAKTEKPAAKPAAQTEKPAAKPAAQTEKPVAKPANKVYHIAKRKEDGMWQIKAAGGEKAIKLFKTQKEAIDYCKTLAENQEASIMIHKEDGSFRKLTY